MPNPTGRRRAAAAPGEPEGVDVAARAASGTWTFRRLGPPTAREDRLVGLFDDRAEELGSPAHVVHGRRSTNITPAICRVINVVHLRRIDSSKVPSIDKVVHKFSLQPSAMSARAEKGETIENTVTTMIARLILARREQAMRAGGVGAADVKKRWPTSTRHAYQLPEALPIRSRPSKRYTEGEIGARVGRKSRSRQRVRQRRVMVVSMPRR